MKYLLLIMLFIIPVFSFAWDEDMDVPETLSTDCTRGFMMDEFFGAVGLGWLNGTLTLNAGERLTIKLDEQTGFYGSVSARLQVNGVTRHDGYVPAQYTYTATGGAVDIRIHKYVIGGRVSVHFTCAESVPGTGQPGGGSGGQGDADRDGVPDRADNCIYVVNPDQADTYGDDRGDACEAPYYDARYTSGVVAYEQKNGWFYVAGYCYTTCRVFASFDPATLASFPDAGDIYPDWTGGYVLARDLYPGVMVVAFQVGQGYQINVYSHAPETPYLIDDNLWIGQ